MNNVVSSLNFLYKHGRISIGAIAQAVKDGTISSEDYREITGEDYPEEA